MRTDWSLPFASGFYFPMIVMIWNCQGAASANFMRSLKSFIDIHKPDVLGLLEPKVYGAHADRVCMKIGFDEWVRVEAVGFSGGIWVFWRDRVRVEVRASHPQFLLLKATKGKRDYGTIAVVYASPAHDLRRNLWMDLTAANCGIKGPWISIGDFNAVLSKEEVSNPESFNDRRCSGLREWIFMQGLVDIGYRGAPFTWVRGTQEDSYRGARLDRALANIEWCNQFRDATLTHIQRVSSDHAPLLLEFDWPRRKEKMGSLNFRLCGSLTRTSKRWSVRPGRMGITLKLMFKRWMFPSKNGMIMCLEMLMLERKEF